HGYFENGVVDAEFLQDIVGRLLDNLGARIEVLIDTVSEAHKAETAVFVFGFSNPFFRISAVVADVLKHDDHLLIGATVKRPPESVDARGNRGVDAGLG